MPIGDKSYTAEINDSEFEREGWKNGRYKGTKLTAAKINEFTAGDITYGKEPVIEQYSKTVYVFNQAESSFVARAGVFYPTTDGVGQTLPDKEIVGSTKFKIDRAVTFTVGDLTNFTQFEPGADKNDPNFFLFDTLTKHDLALFNTCSVKFFDNANNGVIKKSYNVMYNKGEFLPAAAYFQTATDVDPTTGIGTKTATQLGAAGENITYTLSNGAIMYINPNIEDWFIAQTGASGSQGTLNDGNTAIGIDHLGNTTSVNSMEGYLFELSKRLSPKNDSYYISFDKGKQSVGSLNEKHLLKAFDVRELEHSGSNIFTSADTFKIKTTGKYGGEFTGVYNGVNVEEFILFREKKLNNVIHLDFNFSTEAPAGVGNGGVIIPNNLHPEIKKQLNTYLSNAGLGSEGGALNPFGLGSVTAIPQRGQGLNSLSSVTLLGDSNFNQNTAASIALGTSLVPSNLADLLLPEENEKTISK